MFNLLGFNDDTLICCFLLALGYGVSFPLLAQFILYWYDTFDHYHHSTKFISFRNIHNFWLMLTISFNFENLIRDLPTWPWIVTFIPTIFLGRIHSFLRFILLPL